MSGERYDNRSHFERTMLASVFWGSGGRSKSQLACRVHVSRFAEFALAGSAWCVMLAGMRFLSVFLVGRQQVRIFLHMEFLR